MGVADRKVTVFTHELDGLSFEIRRLETPFREGLELETEVDGKLLRVSDRQLGEGEALRLLEIEIRALLEIRWRNRGGC